VRLLRELELVQVAHPQPITGTPIDVPVPKKIIWPRTSVVIGELLTANSAGRGKPKQTL
jgi:hypothetical protein